MTTKNYEKRCARLVQEELGVSYSTALSLVAKHQTNFPEVMGYAERASAITSKEASEGDGMERSKGKAK